MIKAEYSVVINRPIEEVFAFVANIENNPQWQSGTVEAEKASEGPVGVGTRYRMVYRGPGRRIEQPTEITEYEQNTKVSWRSTSPFEVEGSCYFEAVESGTKVTLRGEAEPGGFFKLAEPILARVTQRQTEAYARKLKDLLETRTHENV